MLTTTKRRVQLVTIAVIAMVVALYIVFMDRLPPRTPQKVARVISGLRIPRDLSVVAFEDQWNFRGDGFTEVRLSAPQAVFDKISAEAKEKGFTSLRSVPPEDSFALSQLPRSDGLYRIARRKQRQAYSLTVLNAQTHEIVTRLVAP